MQWSVSQWSLLLWFYGTVVASGQKILYQSRVCRLCSEQWCTARYSWITAGAVLCSIVQDQLSSGRAGCGCGTGLTTVRRAVTSQIEPARGLYCWAFGPLNGLYYTNGLEEYNVVL